MHGAGLVLRDGLMRKILGPEVVEGWIDYKRMRISKPDQDDVDEGLQTMIE